MDYERLAQIQLKTVLILNIFSVKLHKNQAERYPKDSGYREQSGFRDRRCRHGGCSLNPDHAAHKWHFLIQNRGTEFQLTCVSWYLWAEPPPRSWNWPSCWVDGSPFLHSWSPCPRRRGLFRTKTRSRWRAEGATSWKRTGGVRCWCEPGWFGWLVWSKLPEARFKVFVHLSKSFAGKNHKNSFDCHITEVLIFLFFGKTFSPCQNAQGPLPFCSRWSRTFPCR